jgi:hypothetical protein
MADFWKAWRQKRYRFPHSHRSNFPPSQAHYTYLWWSQRLFLNKPLFSSKLASAAILRWNGYKQGCQIFLGPNGKNVSNYHTIYQTATNYTKRLWIIPNGNKLEQINVKYTNMFHPSPSKVYKNWDFWSPTKPSGNPGYQLVESQFQASLCSKIRQKIQLGFWSTL